MSKSFFDQIEDGCVKGIPACGGILGALVAIGLLKGTVQPLLAAALGGAIGALILGVITFGFFRLINPNRDRGQGKKKDW